ncbi:bifunctional hydroxymethylpyrimidine kinase/phosphomethylpyrimidine kinase [Methanothermobacter sp.]|uniref:bifunctional hydroxymethylpyrimidine kinase/phosphomethylpyrimidine kinase n=1 Tax=Methanothermobacter sp. TaxID=1884223 RepID=UPI0026094939|nr:bifunctional hydroxymethylpyrimidine kinase/phosphomethylpyrimidine kinase [Methanothermobacter sp.]MDI9618432.1 bifunctional hydroxymethylpyrimidine kinase/phosphomethylpyrimidine kinase [Methanothermobacter sp.]
MMALSIAGFDPSGGAGILADIKTFSAIGVYGAGVITALTAQNVRRVSGVMAVPPEFVAQQIDLVMEDLDMVYAKTGMLYSEEIVLTVAEKIREYDLQVVVDPVMVAASGGSLSAGGFSNALKDHLLPEALIATPNVAEAERLSGVSIRTLDDAVRAARVLGEICDVIITGGHLDGNNVLCIDGDVSVIEGELVESRNTHGSGCSFSAATAAYLEMGLELVDALKKAGDFVREAIRYGHHGTLNQFWMYGEKVSAEDLKD